MSLTFWVGFTSLLFILFWISLVIVTLILLDQVEGEDLDLNQDMLTYVKVGNWLLVALWGMTLIFILIGSAYYSPLVTSWRFEKLDLGLRKKE